MPDLTYVITCNDCGGQFDSPRAAEVHSCYVVDMGGRCEDYPCCGHTDGDGCQTLPEHTAEFWHDRLTSLMSEGYDDYDIDMMMSRFD